jgi:hypothetical protein
VTWPLADGQSITQWWNGSVASARARAVATNASYNGRLDARGRATLGVVGTGDGAAAPNLVRCAAR